MLSAGTPFVLLDDARPGGGARLYRAPTAVIRADRADAVRPALERLRDAARAGLHAAGYLAYDAGHALEPKLAAHAAGDATRPLMWFGLFEQAEPIEERALLDALGDPAGAWTGPVEPLPARGDYDAAFAQVSALIAAGDIYQANLSFRAQVRTLGSPLALYARLRAAAQAGWGGIVHDGRRWLLSLSPELFFRTDGRTVEARPMKGTAPRGRNPAGDEALAARLAADPKERAENLMIVDLIRNDLSRVAVPGSVRVPALFAVERYPTVQQMVSEVEATLAPGRDAVDVLQALFPCGSITGAPKLRAMEIIRAVEADARDVYTGSIGAIAPDGHAAFNVAIRTLILEGGMDEAADTARLGLGSAVVADSTAEGEWRECLAKAAFVSAGQRPFDLIETMRFDPDDGFFELERHIARLGASAQAFGFAFDRHAARNELHTASFRLVRPSRIRLRLSPAGGLAIASGALPPAPAAPWRVAIVPLPVDVRDFRLAHKTGDRGFYDAARRTAGTDEVVFARPDGRLTEGSRTSLFVPRGDRLVTPPLADGVLPGVLRASLIDAKQAEEGDVRAADLADGFFLGNALRGLVPAQLARGCDDAGGGA